MTQHFRAVENLICEWARAIDENRVEAICDLFAADGRSTVIFDSRAVETLLVIPL